MFGIILLLFIPSEVELSSLKKNLEKTKSFSILNYLRKTGELKKGEFGISSSRSEFSCRKISMKSYEIRIGTIDKPFSVPYNDRQYNRLSDAANALKGLLELMEAQPELVEDDLCFWIIRTDTPVAKKAKKEKKVTKTRTIIRNGKPVRIVEKPAPVVKEEKKPTQTLLAQVIAGVYDNINQFGYEGMYFLNNASDFERMILAGGKESGWVGNYIVVLSNEKQKELCFYSDLDIILQSLVDLSQNKAHIADRLITILKREPNGEAKELAEFYYSLAPNGDLELKSTLQDEEGEDHEALASFVEEQLKALASKEVEVVEESEEAPTLEA